MLVKILPRAKTIFVPYNPNDESPRQGIARLKPAAAKLGIRMVIAELRTKEELEAALEKFPAEIDAIFVPTDSMMVSMTPKLVKFSIDRKIPLTTPNGRGWPPDRFFPMVSASRTLAARRPGWWTGFSKGPSPKTCRWNCLSSFWQ